MNFAQEHVLGVVLIAVLVLIGFPGVIVIELIRWRTARVARRANLVPIGCVLRDAWAVLGRRDRELWLVRSGEPTRISREDAWELVRSNRITWTDGPFGLHGALELLHANDGVWDESARRVHVRIERAKVAVVVAVFMSFVGYIAYAACLK